MTDSLFRETDGACDSATSNAIAIYSPNICFLGCNKQISATTLVPPFHLDHICFLSRASLPAPKQLSGTHEGKDYYLLLVLH